MSKGSRQALVMLGCMAGTFRHLHNSNLIAHNPDLHQMSLNSSNLSIDVIRRWRQNPGDYKQAIRGIALWHDSLKNEQHKFSAISWVYILSRILADMQAKCNSFEHRELLNLLDDPVEKLEKFIDPDHSNWREMDKANIMMNELYEIIKWEW